METYLRNCTYVFVCLFLIVIGNAQPGEIYGWGWNDNGQVTVPDGNDFVAIAAGDYHSLALRSDGTLVGWGNNYDSSGTIYYGQATPPAGFRGN